MHRELSPKSVCWELLLLWIVIIPWENVPRLDNVTSFGDSEILTRQTKTWNKENLQRLMASPGILVKVQWLDFQMHFTNRFLGGGAKTCCQQLIMILGKWICNFMLNNLSLPILETQALNLFLTGSTYSLSPGRKAIVKLLIFLCEKWTFNSNIRSGGTHRP